MNKWLLAAIALVISVSAIWSLTSESPPSEEPHLSAALEHEESAKELGIPDTKLPFEGNVEASPDQPKSATPDDSRTRVTPAIEVTGHVLDEQGSPVEGANVSWTDSARFLALRAKGELAYAAWLDISKLATTDSAGAYSIAFDEAPGPGSIWASALGFEPTSQATTAEASTGTFEFTLPPKATVTVGVMGADGLPAAGAHITQRGMARTRLNGRGTPSDQTARLAYFRQSVADEKGEATVAAAPQGSLYQAQQGTERSGDVYADIPERVDLTLGGRLQVEGQVTNAVGLHPLAIHVFHVDDTGNEEFLGLLEVDSRDKIVASGFPLHDSGQYRFQLEGPHVAPSILHTKPEPGEAQLNISLRAVPATDLSLICEDMEGAPVEDVLINITWLDEDDAQSWASAATTTDAKGFASVPCHDGMVWVRFMHPDFLTEIQGPVEPSEEPHYFTLKGFSSLTGTVTFDGSAQSDFTVVHYQGEGAGTYKRVDFTDSEGGKFTIEDVAIGETRLFAMANGFGQSEIALLTLEAGEPGVAELQLRAGTTGTGLILDAENRQPVPGLELRVVMNGHNQVIGIFDASNAVDSDGRFKISGLVGDHARLNLQAPGYGQTPVYGSLSADGKYDFGTVLLERQYDLDIDVIGLPIDGTSSGQIGGIFYDGPFYLQGDDHIYSEVAKKGVVTLTIGTPTGQTLSYPIRLAGKGPWQRTIDIGSGGALTLTLPDFSSSDMEGVYVQLATLAEPTSLSRWESWREVESKQISFSGIPIGEIMVLVCEASGVPLASQATTVVAGEETTLTLRLDAEPAVVRLIDKAGEPIPDATVWALNLENGGTLSYVGTDADGLANLGALPPGPTTLAIESAVGPQMTIQVPELGTLDNPLEIVFSAKAQIKLHVTDRGVPLEGLILSTRSTLSAISVAWPMVAADGNWELTNISAGSYYMLPKSATIWVEKKTVIATESGGTREIEFRRTGGLVLTLRDENGKPVNGLAVNIESQEYATDVATWLAAGKATSTTGLVTNANGEVHFAGVPNGTYAWAAAGSEGTAEVPPEAVGSADGLVSLGE